MKRADLSPVQFEIQRVVQWEEWREIIIPRLKRASKLKIKHLPQLEPHDGIAMIVGSAPSVKHFVEDLRQHPKKAAVISLNGAHQWLIEHQIIPNIHILFEDDLEDARESLGGEPHKSVTYYICSHCSEKVFDQLAEFPRILWHAFSPPQGYQQAIARMYPGEFMVSGGYSTFFRALNIALILGFRDFDLFGCDSSFDASSHVEGYKMADIEPRVTVWGRNPQNEELKKFTTQGGLAFQANEFVKFCESWQVGIKLRVNGDGLLRYLHESRYPEQYRKD